MAGSVNKVILIGNLGADPEVRYTEGSQCVANIRIATNRAYNNRNNERVEETEWHRVVLWGKLGEIAEKYLKKGATIYVEGRLRTRQWTDQNGLERYSTEIVGETMTMLGGKTGESARGTAGTEASEQRDTSRNQEVSSKENATDDLPF